MTRRSAVRMSLVAGSALALLTPVAGAQSFKLIAETGQPFVLGSTPTWFGSLGVPSISPSSSPSGWNIAVHNTPNFGVNTGPSILCFVDDSNTPSAAYGVAAGTDGLPSALGNTAVYLGPSNGSVFSGNTLVPPHGSVAFLFGRPSGVNAAFANVEWPVSSSDAIVVHTPSGSSHVVVATSEGFDSLGRVNGPGAASDISIGRGGGSNLVFRGHHSSNLAKNGIFVTPSFLTNIQTVVDNNTTNPLTLSNFAFSNSNPAERLPVAHGGGAAWSSSEGGQHGVLARPNMNGPIQIMSKIPGKVYGEVSSGGAGLLVYEVRPSLGGPTQYYQSLNGVETLIVDRTMITRRTVLDLDMGSEAIRRNSHPFSLPGAGSFVLTFHAYQLNPHTLTAIYALASPLASIDFGGLFGASAHPNTLTTEPAFFKVVGGGSTGTRSGESDDVQLTGTNTLGQALPLFQEYGAGLGVNSGPGDNPFLINTNAGISERVDLRCDHDVIVSGVTFTNLDVGEGVRFLLDGAVVIDAVFTGNPENVMDGLQYMKIPPLAVAPGSAFSIEHAGSGDGFALSSMLFGEMTEPNAVHINFESPAFTGSAAGTPLAGQQGWITAPAGASPMNVYAYEGNSLGFTANPLGDIQCIAGRATASSSAAQRDVDFSSSDAWRITYDLAVKFDGTLPAGGNPGSISLQPTSTSQSLRTLNRWTDPNTATSWIAGYNVFDAAGVLMTSVVPAPEWTGLSPNHWYRQSTIIDFARNKVVEVSIENLHTGEFASAQPTGWYLEGGASPALPRPSAIRSLVNGAGNAMALDNMRIESITVSNACYADCDLNATLDIFDFLCFGNAFATNDPYACNCDASTGPNTCDIFDFLCFGNAFSVGCP